MLQDGVPAVYRKPASRSERRQSVSRVKAGGVPPPPATKEEEGGIGGSNGDLRGVLEIEPAGKDKDAGAASSLLGRRQPSSKGGGEAYRLLYVCACAVAFVNAMTFSVLGPFLPAYISGRFGSTTTQVGMIMAAYPAVNLATSPLVGWIMNRYGRWKSLFAGLVILTVATALYGLASSVGGLYVASGLHGASLSFIHVSSLGLLSAFPDRLTESMAGIEIWSGVAAILGPPLGCLVVPYGGVSSIFLLVAMFPVCLVLFTPRVGHLVREGKGEGDYGEVAHSAGGGSSLWKVARNRGVLAGAFVTAYNYGVIGFLEVTLAPHLAQTLSTSPRSIGFVLVLPNILFTVTAMKAEDIVDRHGVRRTLLGGLCIMAVSLIMSGPSPALAPALVTRGAARGAIGVGLLAFQVGSALASVPAFTAMQGGVAGMGTGADDMVASAHAMSIGVGEIIGPMVGGYVVELLPTSQAFACEPDVPIVEIHDPIFQLAGELLPPPPIHQLDSQSQDKAPNAPQEDIPVPPPPPPPHEDGPDEAAPGGHSALDPSVNWQVDAGAAREEDEAPPGLGGAGGGGREKARRLLGKGTRGEDEEGGGTLLTMGERTSGETRRRGEGLAEQKEKAGVIAAAAAAAAGRVKRDKMALWPLGRGFLVLATEEEEEEEEEKDAAGLMSSKESLGVAAAVAAGGGNAARDRGEEGGKFQHDDRRLHQPRQLLPERRPRKARPRQAKVRQQQRQQRQHAAAGLRPAVDAATEPPALAAGAGDAGGGVAAEQAAAPFVAAHETAIDLASTKGGERLAARGAAGGEGRAADVENTGGAGGAGGAVVSEAVQGEQATGGDGGGDNEKSCDSSFPLATTLLAWASVFAIAAMYRWLPHQSGASKGLPS